jgi:hypothetical protein
MVVGEIINAQALMQIILILPVGGSANISLCHLRVKNIYFEELLEACNLYCDIWAVSITIEECHRC